MTPPPLPQPRLETGEAAAESNHLVPPAEPYPWLLYCHGEGRDKQTFITATPKSSSSSSSEYKYQQRSIPELRNKTVLVCCHGWLLLSDRSTAHHYSLWNPSTLQSIILPPLNLNRDFVVGQCVLSSPPDTSSSTIILAEQRKSNIIFLRIGRSHQQWIERQYGEELRGKVSADQDIYDFIVYTVCCSEQVYVTTCYSANLMKLDIVDDEDDTSKIILTPLVRLPGTRIRGVFLTRYYVESLGKLFLICSFHGGASDQIIDVEVHKLDLGEKRWEKVCTIEDQVFFLAIRNSVSCLALSEHDRGRIYFPGRSYNIVEKSLSVAFSAENLPECRSTPIWVMPIYQRIHDNQTNGIDEVDKEEVAKEKEVKKTSDHDEDSKETTLLDLPQCIIGDISRHLAFLDYMNFRAVCHVSSKANPVTEWRKTLTSDKNCFSPWLMLCSEGRNKYTFVEPKFGGRYFMRIPEELVGATVHCAKDGWLLMSRDDDSMFFFNPFTKAILPCPPFSLGHHAITYLMSSAPTNSNYLVAAIDVEAARVCVYILNNGDEEWKLLEVETGSNFRPNHSSPATCVDQYYLFGRKGNLLLLEFCGDECGCVVVPEPQAPCDSFHQNFLVECDEEMYSIFVGQHGKWVRVFVYDLSESTMIWREVDSIGKWTMFLSRFSCLSVEAVSEDMEGRIYFPRLNKGSLVFYSLKTSKFHSSDGEDTLMDYADTTEHLLSSWTESIWN